MITLHRETTDQGEITVLRNRATGSFVYCQDGSYQSEADSRGVSLASYVHALHGLVTQSGAADALVIGCGGGTLATMLAQGGTRVTIVDVSPASIVLARTFFSLPEQIPFHLGDGEAYLADSSATFGAVIVDAYVGSTIPEQFRTQRFFATVRQRLAPEGIVLVNVHLGDAADADARLVASAMELAGLPVRILDAPGVSNRNAIVAGGAVTSLRKPRLVMRPEVSAAALAEVLERMDFQP